MKEKKLSPELLKHHEVLSVPRAKDNGSELKGFARKCTGRRYDHISNIPKVIKDTKKERDSETLAEYHRSRGTMLMTPERVIDRLQSRKGIIEQAETNEVYSVCSIEANKLDLKEDFDEREVTDVESFLEEYLVNYGKKEVTHLLKLVAIHKEYGASYDFDSRIMAAFLSWLKHRYRQRLHHYQMTPESKVYEQKTKRRKV